MKSDVGTSNFDINAQKKNLSVICTENDNFANIDPLENRRLAMKKLEAKLEQLRGNKSAHQYEEERKAKRRLSKLKSKVRKKAMKEEGSKENKGYKFQIHFFRIHLKKSKKSKRDEFTGKDYKRLLEKADKRMERIEAIREKNPEKASHIEENIRWNKSFRRVEGQKIKDDPDLLRKSLLRKQKMKEIRRKKWDKRIQFTERKQALKQEKRMSNIQKRKESIKMKKLQKARKKGRIL
ncbi:unnamed protein product [Dracunculus medinensis]|uniref:SURF6 domain-containing protein n=1 Tax=Dracunculus medinensis TaxID=318479 RepID=A0A0N4UDK6_DRAME|nr:unnamed protein product [Dracunculus medinensis]